MIHPILVQFIPFYEGCGIDKYQVESDFFNQDKNNIKSIKFLSDSDVLRISKPYNTREQQRNTQPVSGKTLFCGIFEKLKRYVIN